MEKLVKNAVKNIQKEYISSERIKKRKEYEDRAIDIINKNKGRLKKGHIKEIINFLDSDFWDGQRINKRFGLLLWGRNQKLILEDDEKTINLMFSQIYDRELLDEVEVFTSKLKGVGYGFISCLLYLKNRERYNIFLNATIEGVETAFPEKSDFFGPFKNRYLRFNKLANELRDECNLKPQEMDIILTDLPSWVTEVAQEIVTQPISKPEIIDVSRLNHTGVQGILVELGNLLGYETYVADPSKIYKNKTLAEWATLTEIPPFTYHKILNIVRQIDVIWFRNEGNEFPVACFEIEHTTDVTKGLLRLYQLKGLGSKLFIVAPKNVKTKFDTEVDKTPFHEIKERYLFRSYEELVQFFELAKRYHDLRKLFL